MEAPNSVAAPRRGWPGVEVGPGTQQRSRWPPRSLLVAREVGGAQNVTRPSPKFGLVLSLRKSSFQSPQCPIVILLPQPKRQPHPSTRFGSWGDGTSGSHRGRRGCVIRIRRLKELIQMFGWVFAVNVQRADIFPAVKWLMVALEWSEKYCDFTQILPIGLSVFSL